MAQFLFKVPQPLTKVGTKSPTNHLWCFTWIIKAITSSNLVKPHSLLVVVDVSRPVIIFPSHTNKISHGLFSNNAIFNFFRAEVGWFPKKIKWEKRFENGVVYFERYFWWHLLAEVVVLMLWRERENESVCEVLRGIILITTFIDEEDSMFVGGDGPAMIWKYKVYIQDTVTLRAVGSKLKISPSVDVKT